MSLPEDVIAGYMLPSVSAWDEPGALEGSDIIQIGDMGLLMRMVDGPEVSSNFEVPRETVWQNIRGIFQRFGIRVYVFHDRVEIRGFIPTEVMDIPRGTDHIKRGNYLFGRGSGGWGQCHRETKHDNWCHQSI